MLVADIVGADPMLVIRRIKDALFSQSPQELRGARGFITKIGQVIYLTVAKFRKDFCLERAASLTFFSIISLIPLTVLFFSIARPLSHFYGIDSGIGQEIHSLPGGHVSGKKSEVGEFLSQAANAFADSLGMTMGGGDGDDVETTGR